MRTNGVKLCMMPEVVHMKAHEARRTKSIRELKKRPVTSLEEYGNSKQLTLFRKIHVHDFKDFSDHVCPT
ncbi:hypothetical protein DPMN_065687 [Dreissena polymorpha]|uniref:Uncharacterized protein n=1 Tax=Dreissena polymorpha TaxID=45954 RepID=A0A9D3YWX9_DREPO|nr:hypothetical protein DPMN_065687 [Dreissena polymorpha]